MTKYLGQALDKRNCSLVLNTVYEQITTIAITMMIDFSYHWFYVRHQDYTSAFLGAAGLFSWATNSPGRRPSAQQAVLQQAAQALPPAPVG